jgi:hypothetical protein
MAEAGAAHRLDLLPERPTEVHHRRPGGLLAAPGHRTGQREVDLERAEPVPPTAELALRVGG